MRLAFWECPPVPVKDHERRVVITAAWLVPILAAAGLGRDQFYLLRVGAARFELSILSDYCEVRHAGEQQRRVLRTRGDLADWLAGLALDQGPEEGMTR